MENGSVVANVPADESDNYNNESDEFEFLSEPNEGCIDDSPCGSLGKEAYVLISSEIEAANSVKEQLLKQQETLLKLKENCERSKKLEEMENKVASLQLEIESRDEKLVEKDRAIADRESISEERDMLTAQVCELKDALEYRERIVQELQENAAEGFVSVQPEMLQDSLLATELNQKDQKIQDLSGRVNALEASLLRSKGENETLKVENDELRNMSAAYQEQIEQYHADLREIRSGYEEESSCLRAYIQRLQHTNDSNEATAASSAAVNSPRNNIRSSMGRLARLDGAISSYASNSDNYPVASLVNASSTIHPYTCDQCLLVLSSEQELQAHEQVCRHAIISNID